MPKAWRLSRKASKPATFLSPDVIISAQLPAMVEAADDDAVNHPSAASRNS